MQVDIVIPFFNNEGSIEAVLEELDEEIRRIATNHPSFEVEIIIVNDGSTASPKFLLEMTRDFKFSIRLIELSRNFGQLAAMYAGLEHSNADATIVMSADGQDPAALISDFVNLWLKGADAVVGIRERREDALAARVSSGFAHKLIQAAVPGFPESWFDFHLQSRRVREIVCGMKGRHRFTQGDLLYAGFDVQEVSYVRRARFSGKSAYSPTMRIKNFTDSVLDTPLPIRATSSLIKICVLLVLVYGASLLGAYASGAEFPTGWVLIVGLGLISILINALIGWLCIQYLWRIYDNSREKPLYIIKSSMSIPQSSG